MNHPITHLLDTVEDLRALPGSFYCLSVERLTPYDPADPTTYGNRWEPINPLASFQHSYSDLDPTCGCLGWSKLSPEEIIRKLTEEHLWREATLVFCPRHFESGDYGGSLVELSNLQTFLEEFGKRRGVFELYGGHGSSGLALDVRAVTTEILEDLAALADYPLRDEEHLSALEYEKEIEAWECWAENDFRRAIIKESLELFSSASEAQQQHLEEALEETEGGALALLLSNLQERGNLYWETENLARWCDLSGAAAELLPEDLEEVFSAQPEALELLASLRSVSQLELLP